MKPISVNARENIFQEMMKKIYNLFFTRPDKSIKQKNRDAKRKNTFYFFGDQSVFPEINSLQWDEYGNPYIYRGDEKY